MKDQLKILLDKVYELEGLVNLAYGREPKPESLVQLIKNKSKEIYDLSTRLGIDSNSREEIEKQEIGQEEITSALLPEMEYYSLEEELSDSDENENKTEELDTKSENNSERGEESEDIIKDEKSGGARGKLVFSINDRFRFKKELFGNSDVDFNNTLAVVASMDSFEEAEDYFVNEQNWEMTHEVEKEFLEILKRYFR